MQVNYTIEDGEIDVVQVDYCCHQIAKLGEVKAAYDAIVWTTIRHTEVEIYFCPFCGSKIVYANYWE